MTSREGQGINISGNAHDTAAQFVTREFLENVDAETLRLVLLEMADEHGIRVKPLGVDPFKEPRRPAA